MWSNGDPRPPPLLKYIGGLPICTKANVHYVVPEGRHQKCTFGGLARFVWELELLIVYNKFCMILLKTTGSISVHVQSLHIMLVNFFVTPTNLQ